MQCFIPFILRNEIDGSFPDWFIWPSLCELIHSGTFDKVVGIKIMLYTEHINTLLNEEWTERSQVLRDDTHSKRIKLYTNQVTTVK